MNTDNVQVTVSKRVWERLQEHAEPLVDSVDTVIARLLDAYSGATPGSAATNLPTSNGSRAPAGSLFPERDYEPLIERILREKGGRATSREVVTRVGELVGNGLTELDRQTLRDGNIRWENRVQFARLRMVEDGRLKKGSPRGIWELPD